MKKLTKKEIKLVLDAATKAKAGLAKPVMFFGTAGIKNLTKPVLVNKLHIVDFMPYQENIETSISRVKDFYFESLRKIF